MRLSHYFLPILRDDPKEAEIVSHKLMLRTGMIRQEAAGSYSWLPMGFRVLKKIEQIVREEQNRAGALEVLMPTSGASPDAMTPMERKCCASRTGTTATCFMGQPTRR
jgi:prolyl-tRNA synthetase